MIGLLVGPNEGESERERDVKFLCVVCKGARARALNSTGLDSTRLWPLWAALAARFMRRACWVELAARAQRQLGPTGAHTVELVVVVVVAVGLWPTTTTTSATSGRLLIRDVYYTKTNPPPKGYSRRARLWART